MTRARSGHSASVGRVGERAAARWLQRRGHRVIAQNVRLPGGEIDLVTLDRAARTLCVVEVKSRIVERAVQPPEAQFGPGKRRRVRHLARLLWERPPGGRPPGADGIRIDLVAVDLAERGSAWRRLLLGRFATVGVRHFPNAVSASD